MPHPNVHRGLARLALTSLTLALSACQSAPAAPTVAPTAVPKPTVAASPAVVVASPVVAPAASPIASPSPVIASPSPSPAAGPNPALVALAAANAALPAYAGPRTALKVSYSSTGVDNTPAWFAKEAGIYARNGLDVDLQSVPSTTGIPAILSGEIQIGVLGGSEALSADANGADLVAYGALSGISTYVFMANASIKTIEQIKGTKIGVSTVGSSSDIATRVFLTHIGLDPDKDVSIVAVGSQTNRTAALVSGAIQGGLAQPPDHLALQDQGLNLLFDLATLRIPAATNIFAANRPWVEKNKDVMQRYVDSIIEASVEMRVNRARTLEVISKYISITDPRLLNAAYDYYVGQDVTQIIPTVNKEQFGDSVTYLGKQNPKIASYDVPKMLDNSFVENAVSRGLAGRR